VGVCLDNNANALQLSYANVALAITLQKLKISTSVIYLNSVYLSNHTIFWTYLLIQTEDS